jgi:hypothetical protein
MLLRKHRENLGLGDEFILGLLPQKPIRHVTANLTLNARPNLIDWYDVM